MMRVLKKLQYDDHQQSECVLRNLTGLDFSSPFRLYTFGVMKRLIRLWVENGSKKCRLRTVSIELISKRLASIKKHVPNEFPRKPRILKYFKFWKASEFRAFLFSAIYILCSDLSSRSSWRSFANNLLHRFVEDIPKLYGELLLIYNFHNLLHLSNDVANFGCLDQFSAFPFENCMSKI
ncbi:hypothetical protein J437_LFUL007760 [Ladona fulva]|uniref:Uncharacterized protein n=1 Tax=Ladona fulva TaxID=123851 RepID=A0A8K0K5J8_LADFU|nr:hypothetical protein J437_LFUL007760 [Ladona fulva]